MQILWRRQTVHLYTTNCSEMCNSRALHLGAHEIEEGELPNAGCRNAPDSDILHFLKGIGLIGQV